MQETKALISAMTRESRGGSRAAAPGCGFSRGTTARSVSLSWGAREVGSPCESRGGARHFSRVMVGPLVVVGRMGQTTRSSVGVGGMGQTSQSLVRVMGPQGSQLGGAHHRPWSEAPWAHEGGWVVGGDPTRTGADAVCWPLEHAVYVLKVLRQIQTQR